MAQDRRYLERKDGKWRVSIAVPRQLQPRFGTRLKRPLHTDSLTIANQLKWPVIAELKAQLESGGGETNALLREALEVARLRRRMPEGVELEDFDDGIVLRAEQIAGRPVGETEDPFTGERTSFYDPRREQAAITFAQIAQGRATPLDLHHGEYLKQISPNLTRRTLADDVRALKYLAAWLKSREVPLMLHAVTRRVAIKFMDELAEITGAPSAATHRKYVNRLSRYWAWLLDRDIAQANPWTNLRPHAAPTPHHETERPFTDAELVTLLAGPATSALHDLMRIGALTGARLDTIVDLKVHDCADGIFTFKPQKKERGPRNVPVHSALADIVARRCAGKAPGDPVFPEWPAPGNPKSQRERSFKASNAFTAYRGSVNVDERVEGKRRALVNFHSFRRWFITKAEQAGVAENIIASVVGHKRPGMTLGRYSAGPQIDQLRSCVEAVCLPE